MNTKIQLTVDIVLVAAAVIILIYNFSVKRQTSYFASVVAVCGTVALLCKDVYRAAKNKK